MDRSRLYITVPTLFRCPISLEVMKSPVSLCTGVTYDRSSIQHWLETGHDTCPATMQVLANKDYVPNLNLRHLINLWAQSSTHRLPESGPSSPAPALSEVQVKAWIERIDSGEDRYVVESLVKVVEFVGYCEENRRFLVSFDGFLEVIAGVLRRESVEIRVLELFVRVLDLFLLENGVKEKLQRLLSNQNCSSSFTRLWREGNLKSKIESVRVLEAISINDESKSLVAGDLYNLLRTETDPALQDAVFSFLISIATARSLKTQLVQLGLVQILAQTLSTENAPVSLMEKCLKLLSILSTCKEGLLAISEDAKCAGAIVERLMKVSKTAKEDGVVVVWRACCILRDGRVQEKVVRANGVMKLLVVMQSEGEGIVRKMCGDLVKVLRGGSGGVGRYETRTTHIMPC